MIEAIEKIGESILNLPAESITTILLIGIFGLLLIIALRR